MTGALAASAAPLTPVEALARLNDGPAYIRSFSGNGAPSLLRTVSTPANAPAIYVFKGQNNSLMFVGADDVALPLLGYTDGDVSGDMPPQLEWLLSEYAREISHASALAENAPARAASAGEGNSAVFRAVRPALTNILPTRWDQSAPYNNLCPAVDGKLCYTGCTATAAAQIAYFHKWPAQGTGVKTYTPQYASGASTANKYTGEITFDYGSTTFDWDNMLPDYASVTANTTQQIAVATLMKAVGVAAEMKYGTNASSAAASTCIGGMQEYMDYNTAGQSLDRSNFSRTAWEDMLYRNIRDVGPVLYSGFSPTGGGHAFVFDGYANGYFHVNWGWGGSYNGLFSTTALTPAGEGIGGNGSGDYSFDQSAVFNIARPDATTISLDVSKFVFRGNLTGTLADNQLTVTTDQNWVCLNQSTETFTTLVGAKLVDENGNEQILVAYRVNLQPNYGVKNFYVNLPANLPDGTYNVYPVADPTNTGDNYELIGHPVGAVDHIILTKTPTGLTVTNPAPGKLTISDFQILTPLYLFSAFKISYTVENSSSMEILDGIQPYIYTKTTSSASPSGISILATGGINRLAVGDARLYDMNPAAKTSTEQASAMTCYTNTVPSGQVYLGLCSTNTGEILAEKPVTLSAAAAAPSLEVTSFEFEGNSADANALNLKFKMNLNCKSGYLTSAIPVYIFPGNGGSSLHVINSEPIFMEAGTNQEVPVYGTFPSAETGKSYHAVPYYRSGNNLQRLGNGTYFTVTRIVSGTESVSVDGTAFSTDFDKSSATLKISAPAGIRSVEAFSTDGRHLPLEYTADDSGATARLSETAAGIILFRIALADGEVKTIKTVL